MKTVANGRNLRLEIEKQELDIAATLDCGQCFRFSVEPDGSVSGIAFGKNLRLSQTETEILFYDTSVQEFEKIWKPFFDLDTDYAVIKQCLSQDETLREAIRYSPGIRILRQDSFEALVSFIISQNNNIPRIKGCIDRLCRRFGEPVGEDVYTFPTPEALASASLEDYAGLSLGYRDRYVWECSRAVASGELNLHTVASMPLMEARDTLLSLKGVGVKVAECALLFGFHQMGAFPVDTWMKKALSRFYPKGFPELFAGVAGLAQQYLFHYIRTCPELREDGKPA